MSKLHKTIPKFIRIRKLPTVIMLIIALIGIYFVLTSGNQSPQSTNSGSTVTSTTSSTSANPYAVLAPATVPSKTAECSQQVTYGSDGNTGPITCANGDLNVLEWNSLATLEPTVMTLGYGATLSQVQAALCSDASDSNSDANTKYSNVIETTTYQITALYYGWSFPTNPTTVLSGNNC